MHPLLAFLAFCLVVFLVASLIVLRKERRQRRAALALHDASVQARVKRLREQSRRLAQANEVSGRGSALSIEQGWNMQLDTRPSPLPVIAPNVPSRSTPRGFAPLSGGDDLSAAATVIERVRRSSSRGAHSSGPDDEPWQDTVPDDPEQTTISSVHPLTMKPID